MATMEEKIAGLYAAFFNRAPDYRGLEWWVDQIENGNKTLNDIADGFANHLVFTSTYNGMTNEEFVNAIYTNMLGSTADSDGLAYYTAKLNDTDLNYLRADMVAEFVGGVLDVDLSSPAFDTLTEEERTSAENRQALMQNKVSVSLDFINTLRDTTNITNFDNIENDPAYLASIKVLSGVTEDTSTVTVASNLISTLAEDPGSAIEVLNELPEITDNITLINEIRIEVNDDFSADTSTTGTLELNSLTSGEIETAGDIDWFAVRLQEGQTYSAYILAAQYSEGTLINPIAYLYDNSGEELLSSPSRVTYTPDTSGTYYVGVSGPSFYSYTGTYTVSVREVEDVVVSDTDDFSADTSTTGSIDVNSTRMGEINYYGDTDWIAVDLEANRTYTIDLKGVDTNSGTLIDPKIEAVYDSNSERVFSGDILSSGIGRDDQLIITPSVSSTYYISAVSADANNGSYTLSVETDMSIIPDIGDTLLTHSEISPGESISSTFDNINDHDWFAVDLNAGYKYTIQATSENSTAYLFVRDDNGNSLHSQDGVLSVGLDGVDSAVEFTVDTSGTYYIDITNFNAQEGDYTISIDSGTPPIASDDYTSDTSTSGILTVGSSITGNIEEAQDTDWFKVELEANQRYTIDLEGSPTDKGTLYDPYIHGVYDNTGELLNYTLTTDDNNGEGTNAQLTFRVELSGVYYINAGAFGTYTGTYTLSIDTAEAL